MKWLIVVLFATMSDDVYIFTEPTFDSYDECIESITDPEAIPGYIQKLVLEYKKPMPIRAISCLSKEQLDEIMEDVNNVKA